MSFEPNQGFEINLCFKHGFKPGMFSYNDDGYIHPIVNRLHQKFVSEQEKRENYAKTKSKK